MKIKILFVLISMSLLLGFTPFKKKITQVDFWPVIKGKWCPTLDESGNTVRMQRIPLGNSYLNFFSKDSCEIPHTGYSGSRTKGNYKWTKRGDSLFIDGRAPLKVIKLTNTELHFSIPKS